MFQLGSAIAVMTGNYADAGACELHGPHISAELAKMAEGNEKLAAFLDGGKQISPYLGLALALMPFAMQIAANHGRIDGGKADGFAGVTDPATLAARVKAEIDTKRAEAMEQAKTARDAAASAQARLAQASEAA
jgi:hypothetical protein